MKNDTPIEAQGSGAATSAPQLPETRGWPDAHQATQQAVSGYDGDFKESIAELGRRYKLIDPHTLLEFLGRNRQLLKPLIEVCPEILKRPGVDGIALSLMQDPESGEEEPFIRLKFGIDGVRAQTELMLQICDDIIAPAMGGDRDWVSLTGFWLEGNDG